MRVPLVVVRVRTFRLASAPSSDALKARTLEADRPQGRSPWSPVGHGFTGAINFSMNPRKAPGASQRTTTTRSFFQSMPRARFSGASAPFAC
jgi:hypothetical protein